MIRLSVLCSTLEDAMYPHPHLFFLVRFCLQQHHPLGYFRAATIANLDNLGSLQVVVRLCVGDDVTLLAPV